MPWNDAVVTSYSKQGKSGGGVKVINNRTFAVAKDNAPQSAEQAHHIMRFRLTKRTKLYARFAQLGILGIVVGMMGFIAIAGFYPQDTDAASHEKYLPERAIKMGYGTAIIVCGGLFLLSIALFSIAVYTRSMHAHMRIGLLLAMGLILTFGFNIVLYILDSLRELSLG